eukprot:s634_g25.t1
MHQDYESRIVEYTSLKENDALQLNVQFQLRLRHVQEQLEIENHEVEDARSMLVTEKEKNSKLGNDWLVLSQRMREIHREKDEERARAVAYLQTRMVLQTRLEETEAEKHTLRDSKMRNELDHEQFELNVMKHREEAMSQRALALNESKRVRIQMLGLGVEDGVNRTSPYCVRKGIPPQGLIIEPIAIRAPSAHTKNGFNEVQLKEELLSHPMIPGVVAAMPECYHETDRNLLMDIWEEGFKPGAGAEQGRICTFFNPFPPWDKRFWKIVKGTAKHRNERALFYIPTEQLMEEFNNSWRSLEVGSLRLVSLSVRSPGRYASRDQIIREARLCAEEIGEEDPEAAEIADVVAGFNNKTIRSGTPEEKENMQKLLTYVLDHKEAERAGCTVCPACLMSTPVKMSMCLHCKGMMVSPEKSHSE